MAHRVKLWINTYNNPDYVKQNLDTLWYSLETSKTRVDLQVNIINNHSNFNLPEKYHDSVNVYHDTLKPDWSCGHLSRNWNYAIINGFVDLDEPDCDQLVCCHDDIIWHENWLDDIIELHKTYTFITGDFGCSFHSYLPEAVRTIGLWDERFCNIGYHEADYYLRALIYNRDKSSINDHFGGRVLNPTKVIFNHPPVNPNKQNHMNDTLPYHAQSRIVFEEKWGFHPEKWDQTGVLDNPPKKSRIKNYIYYPYFEHKVDRLEEMNYIVAREFESKWHQLTRVDEVNNNG